MAIIRQKMSLLTVISRNFDLTGGKNEVKREKMPILDVILRILALEKAKMPGFTVIFFIIAALN